MDRLGTARDYGGPVSDLLGGELVVDEPEKVGRLRAQAARTGTTRIEREPYPFAGVYLRHRTADGPHDACTLVAKHSGKRHGDPLVAADQVGAADVGSADVDQHLVVARFVQLQLAQYERATLRLGDGLGDSHAGSLTGGGAGRRSR